MEKVVLSLSEQIRKALDGRSQRWLSFEARIPEGDLSRKMNGSLEFTEAELERIAVRLNAKFKK